MRRRRQVAGAGPAARVLGHRRGTGKCVALPAWSSAGGPSRGKAGMCAFVGIITQLCPPRCGARAASRTWGWSCAARCRSVPPPAAAHVCAVAARSTSRSTGDAMAAARLYHTHAGLHRRSRRRPPLGAALPAENCRRSSSARAAGKQRSCAASSALRKHPLVPTIDFDGAFLKYLLLQRAMRMASAFSGGHRSSATPPMSRLIWLHELNFIVNSCCDRQHIAGPHTSWLVMCIFSETCSQATNRGRGQIKCDISVVKIHCDGAYAEPTPFWRGSFEPPGPLVHAASGSPHRRGACFGNAAVVWVPPTYYQRA